jgi:hypothetical protein
MVSVKWFGHDTDRPKLDHVVKSLVAFDSVALMKNTPEFVTSSTLLPCALQIVLTFFLSQPVSVVLDLESKWTFRRLKLRCYVCAVEIF